MENFDQKYKINREIEIHISNEEKLKLQEIEKFETKRLVENIKKELKDKRDLSKAKKKQKHKKQNQEMGSFTDLA